MLLTHALCAALVLAPQDPKEQKPDPSAKPHEVFAWKSKAGLRYAWVLPKGYDPKTPVALTVICHGTGLDYRWGLANNRPGVFRPNDVVVSVDGPSPGQGGSRLFLGEPKDAKAFKDFLAELRAAFAVDRVFLYGHSQGGFFVVYYAGEHPDTVQGVVAHASGAWNWSKMGKPVHKVAIAFMHGTSDPVVGYGQSPASRDAYVAAGVPLVRLHRLQYYNHWPNAVRANEALAWCEGMTTASPGTALEAARELLRKKPPDEYAWETVAAFGAGAQVLQRLVGEKSAFAQVEAEVQSASKALLARVEAEAKEHVDALAKHVAKKGDLVLKDKSPWLGHLVPLREDFRGIACVEAYFAEIGYDAALKAQQKALGDFYKAFGDAKSAPPDRIKALATALPKAFLCEGFPSTLAQEIPKWASAKKQLSKAELADVARCEAWVQGWTDGQAAYAKIWKKWK